MQWYRFNMFWCAMVALLCIPILSCSSDEPSDGSTTNSSIVKTIWRPRVFWYEAQPITAQRGVLKNESHRYVVCEYSFGNTINVFGKEYLSVFRKVGVESVMLNRFIRVEGEKIYGLDLKTGDEILYHDFSTWKTGDEFSIGYIGGSEIVGVSTMSEINPEYGLYTVNNGYDYVKNIGKVNSGHGLTGYGDTDEDFPIVEGTIILLIKDNRTGDDIFRHPDYDAIIADSRYE